MGTAATTADASGADCFPALAPGQYEIVATLQGFKPSATKVTVVVGQLLQVDLNLAVGGLTETVTVNALASSIDVKQAGRPPTSRPRQSRCCRKAAISSRW